MDDIATEAQQRGIVCTPLATAADVLRNEHFKARGSLVDVDLGGGLRGPIPSGFFEVDGNRAGPVVGPPAVGQHTDEVFAEPRRGAAPLPAARPSACRSPAFAWRTSASAASGSRSGACSPSTAPRC